MQSDKYLESAYRLKENPFASRTDPTVEMAGRKKEEQEWTLAVQSRIGVPASSISFIVGDYGSGKTLSLYRIVRQFSGDARVLCVFLKILPEDRITRFGVDFIQRLMREVPTVVFQRFRSEDLADLRRVYPEPAIVFGRISVGDTDAMRFLRGDATIPARTLEKWGLGRRMDRTEVAEEYLLGFLFLLRRIGVETLLIAVDEVEYIFSQMRGASIATLFNTLRSLYDLQDSDRAHRLPQPAANAIFFLAISAAGWKRLNDLGHREQTEGGPIQALMRRFHQIIELSPLNKRETRQLIEQRLRSNRAGDSPKDQPLIPYDETFVEYVAELSLGNPGEIVRFCDVALQEGLRRKVRLLDRKFAEKAFADRGAVPSGENEED